eukprot:4441018-Amphidinium_carterae.1
MAEVGTIMITRGVKEGVVAQVKSLMQTNGRHNSIGATTQITTTSPTLMRENLCFGTAVARLVHESGVEDDCH